MDLWSYKNMDEISKNFKVIVNFEVSKRMFFGSGGVGDVLYFSFFFEFRVNVFHNLLPLRVILKVTLLQ